MTLGSLLHPDVRFKVQSKNKVEIGLKIPKELAYFEGHFPDFPVVPGVVQVHWAVEFARVTFKMTGFVAQASQIKFSNLMRPLDEICLILDHLPEKSLIIYSYRANEKIYASGRLMYTVHLQEFINDV